MKLKPILLLTLMYCLVHTVRGQSCTGNLGDPVMSVNFGSLTDPLAPLAKEMTSYTHISSDCPKEGEYSFKNSSSCFSDAWHAVEFDHTPSDGRNGNYMMVNANAKGDIYVDKLGGLCPNSTYVLSFFAMNISKPGACGGLSVDPNIIFAVEDGSGNTIASAGTNNITTKDQPAWSQYSLLFKTRPLSPSIVIRLKNNSNSGCGNDFLIDDIEIRPCGPSIIAQVASTSTSTGGACEGDTRPILLNATIGDGLQSPSYQWQESKNSASEWKDIPGATGTSYSRKATEAGIYLYRLVAGETTTSGLLQCRFASNLVTINIGKAPFAQGTNYSSCLGNNVTLFAAGGEKYSWTGPNGFTAKEQSPILTNIQFSDSGLYKVEVTTTNGCTASYFTRLVIAGNPIARVSPEVSICEGSSTSLFASGGTTYTWTPAEGLSSDTIADPVAGPTDTTLYIVSAFSNGCSDTASVRVNVWKKPVADAGPDRRLKKGQPVVLSGTVRGSDFDYYWTPTFPLNDAENLTPMVSTEKDVSFVLHAVSKKGCGESTDSVRVRVYDKINVPNAFSPNGDGINDVWNIDPLDLFEDSQTKVFNRFGQVVFDSRGYPKPWDGRRNGEALPAGTYYYTIQLKNADLLTGWVYIAR